LPNKFDVSNVDVGNPKGLQKFLESKQSPLIVCSFGMHMTVVRWVMFSSHVCRGVRMISAGPGCCGLKVQFRDNGTESKTILGVPMLCSAMKMQSRALAPVELGVVGVEERER